MIRWHDAGPVQPIVVRAGAAVLIAGGASSLESARVSVRVARAASGGRRSAAGAAGSQQGLWARAQGPAPSVNFFCSDSCRRQVSDLGMAFSGRRTGSLRFDDRRLPSPAGSGWLDTVRRDHGGHGVPEAIGGTLVAGSPPQLPWARVGPRGYRKWTCSSRF